MAIYPAFYTRGAFIGGPTSNGTSGQTLITAGDGTSNWSNTLTAAATNTSALIAKALAGQSAVTFKVVSSDDSVHFSAGGTSVISNVNVDFASKLTVTPASVGQVVTTITGLSSQTASLLALNHGSSPGSSANYLECTSSGGSAGDVFVIRSGGSVGIGVASPTNTLSLGNAAAQKFWIENSATDVVGRALTIAAGGTIAGTSVSNVVGGNLILQAGLGTGSGASTISFQTGTTLASSTTLQTMSTKMTILGSGNVGIGSGATTPLATLDIRGFMMVGDQTTAGAASEYLQVVRSNNVIMSFRHINSAAGTGQLNYTNHYFQDTGSTERLVARSGAIKTTAHASQPGGGLVFYSTPAGGSLTERSRISEDGNLGLKQTSFGTSAVGVFAIGNGTAPGSSPADACQMYSADQAAGNACPHFRTENGSIIKLYKTGTYTPTNVTTDRSYDCNATTTEELADVLATLIADLQLTGILG